MFRAFVARLVVPAPDESGMRRSSIRLSSDRRRRHCARLWTTSWTITKSFVQRVQFWAIARGCPPRMT